MDASVTGHVYTVEVKAYDVFGRVNSSQETLFFDLTAPLIDSISSPEGFNPALGEAWAGGDGWQRNKMGKIWLPSGDVLYVLLKAYALSSS